jgi:heat-inducible transcriptional repressor
MEMTPRHRMILKVLIDDFVSDNKPVGSKTLSEKHDIGLSPATVRNVFRDLEDGGYINSRHHSGGRVPTERGYRIYVDNLISLYELSLKEKQRIQEEYLKNEFKLDQILAVTCKVLSLLSCSAGVVLAPKKNFDTLKHLELIHVNGAEVLMILVTRSGVVLHHKLFFEDHVSQESLYQISRFLQDHIKGYNLDEIFNLFPLLLQRKDAPEDFYKIADVLQSAFVYDMTDNVDLYVDGLQNLCANFKDDDSDMLESVFSLLDDKKLLKEFFTKYIATDGVSTFIGETNSEHLRGVSIVATSYRMGEKRIGSLGIIGPQRMNYTRALPLVDFTSKIVSEMITKISK